jgi:hypothetical protein
LRISKTIFPNEDAHGLPDRSRILGEKQKVVASPYQSMDAPMKLFLTCFITIFLYETIGVIMFGLPSLHSLLGK